MWTRDGDDGIRVAVLLNINPILGETHETVNSLNNCPGFIVF